MFSPKISRELEAHSTGVQKRTRTDTRQDKSFLKSFLGLYFVWWNRWPRGSRTTTRNLSEMDSEPTDWNGTRFEWCCFFISFLTVIAYQKDGIWFTLDGELTGEVYPPDGGFWCNSHDNVPGSYINGLDIYFSLRELGGFEGENIWAEGSKMAPFDKEVSSDLK